ncbi:MAG: hypothetical protein M5R38_11695 [Candidatus Methylomirabilis sp.]|nr:hypothetical protein [Candidatus Methylomirabilis sp.]
MPRYSTFQPLLGLTIGDPAGIGPEIIAKAVTHEEIRATCRPVIIGETGIIRRAVRLLPPGPPCTIHQLPAEITGDPGCLEVVDLKISIRQAVLPAYWPPTAVGQRWSTSTRPSIWRSRANWMGS